jgi:hypothetical protein
LSNSIRAGENRFRKQTERQALDAGQRHIDCQKQSAGLIDYDVDKAPQNPGSDAENHASGRKCLPLNVMNRHSAVRTFVAVSNTTSGMVDLVAKPLSR